MEQVNVWEELIQVETEKVGSVFYFNAGWYGVG